MRWTVDEIEYEYDERYSEILNHDCKYRIRTLKLERFIILFNINIEETPVFGVCVT